MCYKRRTVCYRFSPVVLEFVAGGQSRTTRQRKVLSAVSDSRQQVVID